MLEWVYVAAAESLQFTGGEGFIVIGLFREKPRAENACLEWAAQLERTYPGQSAYYTTFVYREEVR